MPYSIQFAVCLSKSFDLLSDIIILTGIFFDKYSCKPRNIEFSRKQIAFAKKFIKNVPALSGHGFVDMGAYDSYFSGEMQNYHVSDEELGRFIKSADELNKQ